MGAAASLRSARSAIRGYHDMHIRDIGFADDLTLCQVY